MEENKKIILMALRHDLAYTARQGDLSVGDLKPLADVFNRFGVRMVPAITQDDLPGAHEFFVSVSSDRCEALKKEIEGCKAVMSLEIF